MRFFISRQAGPIVMMAALVWGLHGPAQAQSQPSTSPAATPAAGAAPSPADILNGAAVPPTTPAHPPAQVADDPVSRFLSDKGLLDTRPVAELAQQVRDKASDLASELVISAMDFLGVPYRRGGDSKDSGFDCSGFTRHVFERSLGMLLPRRAAEQANMPGLQNINQADLKPGDLVFFNTLRHTFSHVGIYIGDNKFIHSPRAGGAVRIEDMRIGYWQQRYDGARRVPPLNKTASARAAAAGADSTP